MIRFLVQNNSQKLELSKFKHAVQNGKLTIQEYQYIYNYQAMYELDIRLRYASSQRSS